MSETIDDNSYILVIILMIIAIVIYGGSKTHSISQIEYNPINYQYLNSLNIFEKQLQKYNSSNFEYLQITNQVDLSECLIPNIIDIFFINIYPYSYFNINKHVKNDISNLMILYNHNITIDNNNDNFKNITHLINDKLMLLIDYNKYECINNICNKYAYYYDITKKISILNIYPIYNNSNLTINITIIIIKKSYWHY
jgi:hypothetical protein